jgi:hypothetical protein
MDVPIRCICPPKGDEVRHLDGDTITFRDRLDFHAAATIRKSVGLLYGEYDGEPAKRILPGEVLALLTEHYVLFGVESWTLVDEKGKAVEPTRSEINSRLLDTHQDVTLDISNEVDILYAEQVMLPLLQLASKSSPTSPTGNSTSPTRASTRPPRKPSKRSSITTIPTGATVTTSSKLDGDSNSSQSSTSAA